MNFWIVYAGTTEKPKLLVKEDIKEDILVLFSSLEGAREFARYVRIGILTYLKGCVKRVMHFQQVNEREIKQLLHPLEGRIRRYVIDPNPRDNVEEVKQKSALF